VARVEEGIAASLLIRKVTLSPCGISVLRVVSDPEVLATRASHVYLCVVASALKDARQERER
jgi:hypothetical protein